MINVALPERTIRKNQKYVGWVASTKEMVRNGGMLQCVNKRTLLVYLSQTVLTWLNKIKVNQYKMCDNLKRNEIKMISAVVM